MRKTFTLRCLLVASIVATAGIRMEAQLSITSTGTAFTQNFDGMGSVATATLPAGFKIGTDWSTGTTATTLAYGTTGTGAVTGTSGGGVINWANGITASATDRSLGFLNTGSFTSPRSIVLKITNNTGGTIGSLNISFDYEKSRSGLRQFDWTFFHGNTVTPATSATGGDQSYPADASNTVISNPPLTTNKSVVLTGLSIANGADYYLRWTFTGLGGSTNGQGISIDNFSITASPFISSNADLSNLTLSTGVLTPAFASGTTNYTSSVTNAVSSITVTPTSSDANATITVNGSPVTSGNPSSAISLSLGDNIITTVVTAQDGITTKTYTTTVNRAATAVPTLSLTTPITDFGNICINTTAGPNSFIIDGIDLNGSDISLAALSGFTYSENVGGPFTTTLTFSYSGTAFTGKQIYVQFSPTAVQSYNGDIVLSGGGVASYPVAVTGSGVNTGASVTTGGSSAVTATTATAAGIINNTGCGTLLSYGIEYSATTGFPDGTGTPIAASNLSAGNFSAGITGLAPNTRYFYKAYVTTSAGTVWGAQQSFTNTPLPVLMSAQTDLSYTQDFADIASWSNFFISGNGANHFGGLSANATGTIPDGVRITAATNSFQGATFGSSAGVQRGTDQIPPSTSIVLLSTGSADNTSSAAIDFYMDFTGLNAGTLSFDWASVNNSTGDRNGSMRVYTSTDGISFTELTFASVLNFTNNFPTSGTKSNIQLPASFNNSATARLRFYYYNGTGGVTPTGSRPKISIDNLTVTGLATTPCTSPSAPATTLNFGTITDVSISGSFTAASPAVDGYLVVMSTNSSLTNNPVDGQNYSPGDNIGDGTLIAKGSSTSFTATGLTPLTTYYFFIFPVNSICTGGPLYYTSTVLNGSATTAAGLPPCVAPVSQPGNLVFGTAGVNSLQASFTGTTADEYLVLVSTAASLSNTPANGTTYNPGDILGNATVVQHSSATTFTANGLSPNTLYYFYIFSFNSAACINGPAYNITAPLSGSQATNPLPPCTTPLTQPGSLSFKASNNAISGAFTPVANVDDYLVVMSTATTLSGSPADNTDYAVGSSLGGGTIVSNSLANSFLASNLNPGTTYYFFIFAANKNCSGGTKYLVTSPLTGNTITTTAPVSNYYFGTLHSHSDYSDGNQDNPGYRPADDYDFAKNSQCMDYLGISEHNHFSSLNNPGNVLSNYHLGVAQADSFSLANPNFLALYGMEWGVISGGGHVLIYGDGMNDLWGWESGSGAWGSSNNYDVFVAKSDYTGASGLFKTVNDNIATNTFASLAHPGLADFNNLGNSAYNSVADNAITATTVESGPSTSSNITYSNPASPMSYLFYYQTLLSKGYHLGATIDHDNHKTTFGRTTYSRTAIVAPALTKTEIIKSMRNMNFYATQDCNTKVDFTVNTMPMGSIFTDRYSPILSVNLTDATTNVSSAVIRVMHGTPGSGIAPEKIDSVIGSSLKFIDNNLADLATGYYYLDISIGAARIISSPVWYTRNDVNGVLPVTLSSFTAQKNNTRTLLKWTTAQEFNTREFRVERSAGGSPWQTIAIVAARGNSNAPVNYTTYDANPAKGLNLYRLKSVDIDDKSEYSATRRVNFDAALTYSIYPNPAKNVLQITTDDASGLNASIDIFNNQSQVLIKKQINTSSQPAQLDISSLAPGIYFMRITSPDGTTSIQKVIKQ